MSPQSNRKPALGQLSTSKKCVTSTRCKLEPVIWSYDTGQRIPCFDRCQLIVTWISNIKEVHDKARVLACRAGEIFLSERSHRKKFSRHLEFFMQWKTGERESFTKGVNDRQEEG